MPLIDTFNGIKIYIYYGDHPPPHIHAMHGEYEIIINIESGIISAGVFPNRQKKMVLKWISANKEDILDLYNLFNPML